MTLSKVKIDSVELIGLNFYKITLKPLSYGYSESFAFMIRRMLFSSVWGYAATEIKILNILHEYDTLVGVKEDILNIILNIKGIVFKLKNKKKKVILNIKKKGRCIIKASDILYNNDVRIINPNHIIANLSELGDLDIKIKVEEGKGYVPFRSNNYRDKLDLDGILLDVCFCPVISVSYVIEKTKTDLYNDLEIINFFIETNGCITAKKALEQSIGILLYQLSDFKVIKKEKSIKKKTKSYFGLNSALFIPISDIEFTIRGLKCINSMNIKYLGDLVKYTEDDLLKVPNLGKRTLIEIKNILISYELSLGSDIKN